MSRVNVAIPFVMPRTHEGAVAVRQTPLQELRRAVLTCMLWENTFYEKGEDIAARIAVLVHKCNAADVAALAVEARDKFMLRHVPLFLVRELARTKGNGVLVRETLYKVIQRVDELAEFCALYWKEGRQPLSAGVKRGLALAFTKFNAYQLAKYNTEGAVKLRDVLFLCHATPKNKVQEEDWKQLVAGTLPVPDTWETELSAGKDKRATFKRLLTEGKLGGLATLRNLRNMIDAGVDEALIRCRLKDGIKKALPFRFVTAARYAPRLEDAIECAMFEGLQDYGSLHGRTGILIDVSESMNWALKDTISWQHATAGQTSRIDVAAGLAIILREKCVGDINVATFSNKTVEVPARRGFALRDAIKQSQESKGTLLRRSLEELRVMWKSIDRLIVITDEQSQDGITEGWAPKSYLINVAPYKNGLAVKNGWVNFSGWSERIYDYILESENEERA